MAEQFDTGGSQGGGGQIEREIIGTVIAGRYRILKKLGEGAMGTVYLGEHLKIGRQDAIKVLRDSLATDADALARFNRGARNVSSIRHPNVCTIYDYSDTGDGHQFLAMEFIPGETLKDVLDREGTIALPRAIALARQVADALQAAHDAGVVHRDLKPANIMIVPGRDGSETVRVVDFDLAKGSRDGEEAEVTRIGWVVGTPEYMSPEQLTGDRLEGTSDVYSLGLVFYRMVTGTFPFQASSTHELILQRLTNAPLPLAEVVPDREFPAGIQAALDRALQRSPTDRYLHAAEFGRDLILALGGLDPPMDRPVGVINSEPVPQTRVVAAQLPSAPPATGLTGNDVMPAPSRRPGLLAAALVGVLVLASGTGLGILLLRDGDPPAPAPAPAQAPVIDDTPPVDQLANDPLLDPNSVGIGTADPAGSTPVAATQPVGGSPSGASPSAADPPPESPPPRPAPARLTVEFAGPVLREQFERLLGPPTPSRATLIAVRDTAELIYNLPGLARSTRAQAASILGNTHLELDNPAECARWMALAVDSDGSNRGYQSMLTHCRSRVGDPG